MMSPFTMPLRSWAMNGRSDAAKRAPQEMVLVLIEATVSRVASAMIGGGLYEPMRAIFELGGMLTSVLRWP